MTHTDVTSDLPADLPAGTDLLSPAEAASRLGVTTQTLRNWSRAGTLRPLVLASGHRRYDAAEVAALAAARTGNDAA